MVRTTERQAGTEHFDAACRQLQEKLGKAVYGFDGQDLESVVGDMLLQKNLHLGVAESCTGGLLAHRVTRVPGSSRYFLGGILAYANELKVDLLGVNPPTIERFGAVSQQTAEAMALGVQKRCIADIGVSITGIAGPDGGTDEKPVGTVFIGISSPEGQKVEQFQFHGDRIRIQTSAAQAGLNMLRLYLENKYLS